MKVAGRTVFLICTAAAAGALVVLDQASKQEGNVPAGVDYLASASVAAKSPQEQRDRRLVSVAARDPFTPTPPPAPPPTPEVRSEVMAPPPPPAAPPLPFRYFGRVKGTNGKSADFVERDNQIITVDAGETLDDSYRVERIDETEIVFLHLPTQQRQSLSITLP